MVEDMDLVIDELIIEKDRVRHIARHNVVIEEVLEIVNGDFLFIAGKEERWLLIGKTQEKRFLTVIVGVRNRKNSYGLVTARPSSKEERNFYKEFTFQQGGGEK